MFINGQVSENRYGLDGLISEVRIYNRALSSNEVAQLYALESTPPPVIAPTIATQPFDQSIALGQNTSFTINATGTGPFSFQWLKDGVALTNQTNASLVITNAQSNAVGYYSCTVADANSNTVTSSNAALNISGVPFWLWQGLVAYYPFKGNFEDYSGYCNNFTNNGATFGSNRFGFESNALSVESTDYLISRNNIFISGNSDRTISMWLCYGERLQNMGWSGWLLSFGDQSYYEHFGLNCDSASFGVDINCWGYGLPTGSLTNRWRQILCVYSAENKKISLYSDGQLIDCTYLNEALKTAHSKLIINKDIATSDRLGISGKYSDLRIYNRAFSSDEVASLYALESTPPGPTNSQAISFPSIPTLTLTNGAYTLGATASSGLPVSYAIGDTNVATLTNCTLIPLGVGTTTVVASQAGDTNYLPATPVTNTLVVTLAQQSVTPIAVAIRTYGSLPFGLTLPTNASGLPITPRIASGPATLSGTNLILTGTGTVTLAYDAPGSSVYAAASVTNSFAVPMARRISRASRSPSRRSRPRPTGRLRFHLRPR